jgi:arabinan endo-1,5-alpha-L-arabinosidase
MKRLLCMVAIAVAALPACSASGNASQRSTPTPTGDQVSVPTSTNDKPSVPTLTGDLRTHDPALVRAGRSGMWYVFSTGDEAVSGGAVQIRSSSDGRNWEYVGAVFEQIPAWIEKAVPGVSNLWAPDIVEHDGTYYLYYAASTFGSNHSLIALATNTTLDPDDPAYHWVDRGAVLRSERTDDYNAIDPGIVVDGNGTPWMAFGSFWSGIRMIKLRWPSGLAAPAQQTPLHIADRQTPPNAIEAPYIVRHGAWYYLFASFDFCCRGTASTYHIVVGRSRQVTGPYLDQDGTPMLNGGGSAVLADAGSMIGPGGQSVYENWLAYHYYDADAGGDFRLGLRRIEWGADGWPRVTAESR